MTAPFLAGVLTGASALYVILLACAELAEARAARRERDRMRAARRACRPRVIRDVDTDHRRVAAHRGGDL